MRKTEDGHNVFKTERVYEILWNYHNAEVSIAVPSSATPETIPPTVRIWKHRINCERECARLNDQEKARLERLVRKFT